MPRVYHSQSKDTLTISAAARELEVTRRTFQKWIELGYVKLVKVGPGESSIRRVQVSEVARLKREA